MKWTTIQIRKWKLQKTWFWLWKTRFYKMPVICNCFRWPTSIKWDDSWSFFALLVSTSFFNSPVTQWQANDAYQQGKYIVDITHVANNYAESKVKMVRHKKKHYSMHSTSSWKLSPYFKVVSLIPCSVRQQPELKRQCLSLTQNCLIYC